MNPEYFGDSYDVVKRFLCAELKALKYSVSINPMFTGTWSGGEAEFYRFVGADRVVTRGPRTALFFDPDTGVNMKPSNRHLSLKQLAEATQHHELVFSFDQSFSRQLDPISVMQFKLAALRDIGTRGMYYNSHARFLFAASEEAPLIEFRNHLIALGMPECRLVVNGS